jgi:hypothetical protein
MLEFLDWLAPRPRTYAQVMERWRTSCPRLSTWEDALAEGLVRLEAGHTRSCAAVTLTDRGRAALQAAAACIT